MELEIKHIAPYLPYRLKGILIYDQRSEFEFEDWVNDVQIFSKGSIWEYAGYADDDLSIPLGEGEFSGFLSRNGNSYCCFNSSLKPILRPLTDLTKKIEHNGEKFVAGLKLVDPENEEWDKMKCEEYNAFPKIPKYPKWIQVIHNDLGQLISINPRNIEHLPYSLFKVIIEWHFDVFGLIDAGLAIDINTLTK